MSRSSIQASQLRSLISQLEAFEDQLELWQTTDPRPDSTRIRATQSEYVTWHTRAKALVASSDRAKFQEMYEGTTFRPRVRAFLNDPFSQSPLYDEEKPNPFMSRWSNPFERTFRDSAAIQRELLTQAILVTVGESVTLDELGEYLRRLPDFLTVLSQAGNPRLPTPDVQDESDLQVLVHAMLRMLYDDVRAEDPLPQHAGGSSRVDFLLRETGVVIETKMTRKSLTDSKLGAELLVDWGRYPHHPDCRAIFALVYDPKHYLKNPAGIEHDLSGGFEGLATRVVVVR